MSRGVKCRTEEVFDRVINDYDTDEFDSLSENESEDDILSQTGQ